LNHSIPTQCRHLHFDRKAERSERGRCTGAICAPHQLEPTHCGRGAQHRPAHRATHLQMCHFAAHQTQKNTLIEFTVKTPSTGHVEWWGGRARRGLSKPIPAVQLDTYAASGAKFGPRWTSSSYPTNLTNLSTTPRPPLPNTRLTPQNLRGVLKRSTSEGGIGGRLCLVLRFAAASLSFRAPPFHAASTGVSLGLQTNRSSAAAGSKFKDPLEDK